MKKEICAGLIIYRLSDNNKPRFLLLYHGGRYWNFPKGHIEKIKESIQLNGINNKENDELIKALPAVNFPKEKKYAENSVQAAFRETMEETGIKRKDLMLKRGFKVYQKYRFLKGKISIFKTIIYYLAETKVRQINISEEHEGYGWFSYKDALYILSQYKGNQKTLRKAYNFICLRTVLPLRQFASNNPADAQQN